MSTTRITKKWYVDDVLTEPTSIVLSDPTGAYGVKRNDTGAVVVADGTAMEKLDTGYYTYSFADPDYGLTYTYWIEIVYSGETYYYEGTVTGGTSDAAGAPARTGIMDLATMVDLFNIKVGDPKANEFNISHKLHYLNQGQNRVIRLLKREMLEDIDASDTSQTLGSSGEYDLSSLTYTVFDNYRAIDAVRLTNGNFCDKVSYREYMSMINKSYTINSSCPIYYRRGNIIYVVPYSGHTIDVYYMRKPNVMTNSVTSGNIVADTSYYVHQNTGASSFTVTYNSTEYTDGDSFTGVSGVTTFATTGSGRVMLGCEFDNDIQETIVLMSAYMALDDTSVDNEYYEKLMMRAQSLYAKAMHNIDEMNKNCKISDSTNLGIIRNINQELITRSVASNNIYNC